MSRRSEVVEVRHIMRRARVAALDMLPVRLRAAAVRAPHEALQIGGRSRRVVNHAG